jgi:hypothetical protein
MALHLLERYLADQLTQGLHQMIFRSRRGRLPRALVKVRWDEIFQHSAEVSQAGDALAVASLSTCGALALDLEAAELSFVILSPQPQVLYHNIINGNHIGLHPEHLPKSLGCPLGLRGVQHGLFLLVSALFQLTGSKRFLSQTHVSPPSHWMPRKPAIRCKIGTHFLPTGDPPAE